MASIKISSNWIIKLMFIALFLTVSADCLKRNKNVNNDKKAVDEIPATTPVTKTQQKPKQQKIQTTQVTHTTNIQSKAETPVQKEKQPEKAQVEEESQQKNELADMSKQYQFSFQPKENQYVLPVSVGSQNFSLGLVYDEKQTKNGKQLPWLFTNLSGQNIELCDASNDCQQVKKILKCQADKSKTQSSCVYVGKAKYSTQQMQSKKKAKIKFQNNGLNYEMNFISPIKINMKDNKVGENQISGLINLALDKDEKYSKSIIISNKKIKVVSQKQIQLASSKEGIIQFTKTSFFSFSSNKELHLKTIHVKSKQVTNDLKQSYQKIKIKFNNADKTMAVNKNILIAIKNILKKQYFGDRCKIKQDTIICSAAPIKNITKILFCRDSSDEKCLQLSILKWIIKQEKPNNVYKLLVEENKDSDGENTIIFYPRLSQIFQIYARQGVVTAIKQIQKTTQVEKQQDESQETVQEVKKTDKKQNQQNKIQKKKQSQKVEDEDQDEETQQQDVKQTPKQNKEASKKQQRQADTQDEEQQQKQISKKQESQGQQKPTAKSANMKKQKKQQEVQQEQQIKPKPKKKTKVKHMPKGDGKQGSREQERQYSRGILFFVFVYGLVFIVVLVIIKFKAQESIAAAAIDRFLDITWYGIVKNYFNKSQGYNAPKFEEDEGGQSEQIDHSDSVAVGYPEKEGRDLFWEKNSVEGI